MVLERSVPLLQQAEEVFGMDEGIHEGNNGNKKHCMKTETKTEGEHAVYCLSNRYSVTTQLL